MNEYSWNEPRIKCRNHVYSDENISSKMPNLGGFRRIYPFDKQLNKLYFILEIKFFNFNFKKI